MEERLQQPSVKRLESTNIEHNGSPLLLKQPLATYFILYGDHEVAEKPINTPITLSSILGIYGKLD